MATIQKRADELKLGDVFGSGEVNCVVVGSSARSGDLVYVPYIQMGKHSIMTQRFFENTFFQVQVPDLTPAQQHAEEMVELLLDVQKRAVDPMALIPQRIAVLIDKIKPPEPPTLEEALTLVEELAEGHTTIGAKNARDLLERARRAGVRK